MLEPDDLEQIRQIVSDSETRIIGQVVERIAKAVYDSETRLLTEFHKWASPFEARQRSHREAIRALDIEYESLADRLKKLDRGEPPAA